MCVCVCVCVMYIYASSWQKFLSLSLRPYSNPSPATAYPTEDWINILDPLTTPTKLEQRKHTAKLLFFWQFLVINRVIYSETKQNHSTACCFNCFISRNSTRNSSGFSKFCHTDRFVFTVAGGVVYIYSNPDTFTSSSYVNTVSELFQAYQNLAPYLHQF